MDTIREAAEPGKGAGETTYDYFCTTLTISPMKSAEILNRIGEEVGTDHGEAFLPSDFKKNGGYQKSIELSREYDLYRQDFCGCEFSKAASEKEREERMAFRDK